MGSSSSTSGSTVPTRNMLSASAHLSSCQLICGQADLAASAHLPPCELGFKLCCVSAPVVLLDLLSQPLPQCDVVPHQLLQLLSAIHAHSEPQLQGTEAPAAHTAAAQGTVSKLVLPGWRAMTVYCSASERYMQFDSYVALNLRGWSVTQLSKCT